MSQLPIQELSVTIKSIDAIQHFINENFEGFKATQNELLIMNHHLYAYQFNRVLKDTSQTFTLNGLPVKALYGYVKNKSEIALYLFLDVNLKQTDRLKQLFGMPWNVNADDYRVGDYDMLLWRNKLYEVSMLHDYVSGSSSATKLLCIYTIPFKDLSNISPWD